jgi:AcrR family transcriptional regulator
VNHYDRLDRLGTERQHVKDAAQRLLTGTARNSNGTPTVAALAREAGINRTSLYQRHPDLIAEFKAGTATATAVTPAAQTLKTQLDAASTRITELEAENARLHERVRALTALAVEMSLESGSPATVIPLKRLAPPHREKEGTRTPRHKPSANQRPRPAT